MFPVVSYLVYRANERKHNRLRNAINVKISHNEKEVATDPALICLQYNVCNSENICKIAELSYVIGYIVYCDCARRPISFMVKYSTVLSLLS